VAELEPTQLSGELLRKEVLRKCVNCLESDLVHKKFEVTVFFDRLRQPDNLPNTALPASKIHAESPYV
jgi:hypothetical protein